MPAWRTFASLPLVLLCLHCGESSDDSGSHAGGSGGTGGQAGASGSGGTSGSAACTLDALPGPIAKGSWDDRFSVGSLAGPDGDAPHVADFARDTDGSVLAAGRFRWLGSEPTRPLVRSGSGQSWQPAFDTWQLEPPEFGGFSAIAVGPNGELALATTGISPEIWIDTGNGLESIGTLADGTGAFQYVRTLAWYANELWVAGTFQLAGEGLSHLAVWDGSTWNEPPGGPSDGPTYELLLSNQALYVGGFFDSVGGIDAAHVAKWDGITWTPLDMTWPGSGVFSLAASPTGELVAGGYFSDEACPTHGSIARWTGTEWQMLGAGVSYPDSSCGGSTPGFVHDLAFHQGKLYAAGTFTHADGAVTDPSAVPASNFARFDDVKWSSLDGGIQPAAHSPWIAIGVQESGIVGQRLFSDGERLLAGILAPGVGTVASPALIAYENDAWVAQGPAPKLGLHTDHVLVATGGSSCSLHVLGNVSHVQGHAVESPVLRLDDDTWTEIGGATPEGLQCDRSIAVSPDGTTYIACIEPGKSEFHVLVSEGSAWSALTSIDVGNVSALAIDASGALWAVGGRVGEVGLPASGFVARRDADAWQIVSDTIDAPVTHIDFSPTDSSLVIGGEFTHIDGEPRAYVAKWNGTEWLALGDGLSAPASAIEYGKHAIYAAERSPGTAPAMPLGRFDGTTWTNLATSELAFPELVLLEVDALVEVDATLFVSGSLYAGEFPPRARGVLLFDGSQFAWLDGGVSASFLTNSTVTSDGIWFGGAIAEAGLDERRVSTLGLAHFRW